MKKTIVVARALALILATSILLSSCVSTTLIQSVPPGASVKIDGETKGTTPYAYSDSKIVFSNTSVVLEKEGYHPFSIIIQRNEEPNVGAIIGGFFIWPIWLWALDYKPMRTYELAPVY